jgi:hypothetical protein
MALFHPKSISFLLLRTPLNLSLRTRVYIAPNQNLGFRMRNKKKAENGIEKLTALPVPGGVAGRCGRIHWPPGGQSAGARAESGSFLEAKSSVQDSRAECSSRDYQLRGAFRIHSGSPVLSRRHLHGNGSRELLSSEFQRALELVSLVQKKFTEMISAEHLSLARSKFDSHDTQQKKQPKIKL